jgi:hypothetical protein
VPLFGCYVWTLRLAAAWETSQLASASGCGDSSRVAIVAAAASVLVTAAVVALVLSGVRVRAGAA